MAALSHFTPQERRIVRVEIDRIEVSPYQPRREVEGETIAQLAESMRQVGLLSPLLVRRVGGGRYELVAGERRLRAARLLGWESVEVIIAAVHDMDSALIGLIENLQREELHFLDTAEACRRILNEHRLTQEELAAALGKSPSALANLLRLLRLSEDVRRCVREEGLSERHARALLRANDSERLPLAQRAAKGKCSVRELEAQIERQRDEKKKAPQSSLPAGIVRDNRLVINALRDTVRQLKRIGVPASSRVEPHGDYYDVIVTIRTPSQV